MQYNKSFCDLARIKNYIYNNWQIIAIIVVFFFVRMFFLFTRYHMPVWDEAVYLGIGKYIYSSGISGLWESIRPLGLPIITGLYWSFGLDQMFFSELTAVIFSVGTIFVTYLIGKKVFDKNAGIIAAVLVAIFPVFFYYSGIIMTEIPSTFFVLLAIYLFIENRLILAGIASGIAFMFKFPQGIIFPILAFMLTVKYLTDNKAGKSKTYFQILADKSFIADMLRLVLPFLIISFAFFVFNYHTYAPYSTSLIEAAFKPLIIGGAHQNNIYQGVLGQTLESHLYNAFYYFIIILKNSPFLFLSLIAFIVLYFKDKLYKNEKIALIFLSLIIYLTYYSYIIIKQERFTIMFMPFLCIISSYLFLQAMNSSKKSVIAMASYMILLSILLFSAVFAINTDSRYYAWQNDKSLEPKIVNEFYQYFETSGNGSQIEGPILTTDPVFAAYSDKRFIPLYDTTKGSGYINSWESNIRANAVVYVNSSFPCFDYDHECILNRNIHYYEILKRNVLVYNSSSGKVNYEIFVPKSDI
jgi:asparagine N-glycosylation enzyme membrane subunit Stt3